jgi:hypothetical protein
MKGIPRIWALVVMLVAISFTETLYAQTAVEYLHAMGIQMDAIKDDTWDYTSSVAHGKSAKKVEAKRKILLTTVKDAKRKISSMQPYKGDAALRDSMVSYLNLSYAILNDDYGKIVDLEAIAEQSYDAMEAYLTAQEMANQKLDEAGDFLSAVEKDFAKKNDITLLEDKDKTTLNLEKAGKVMKYYNEVYLIFFKSFKQEAYLLEAMAKGDMNAVEQNNSSLHKVATEALYKLDTIKPYHGDGSLTAANRELMRFYLSESKDKVPAMVAYFLKKENFDKIKTSFESKPQSKRTQADVDGYNKGVSEMNTGVNQYNATNNELNKKRSALLDTWNKSVQVFLDSNTPKGKN